MNAEFFRRLLLYAVLVLAQALVLNHIHLFGYATPLLYVYFVVSFPRNYPKWGILLWSFLLGLNVDAFSNTPGVAASAMTLIGLLQPYVLELFMQRDSEDDFQPSINSMGAGKYIYFTLLLTFIYCIVFFTVEMFIFFNWLQWILNILTSTLLSLLFIVVIDSLRKR
ncbi:MAG: rod shape-determining protein MreD [Prevotella sp.]